MIKLWSEVPGARAREIAADLATAGWLALWGSIAWRLFDFLAQLAGAGRFITESGTNIGEAGDRVGDALQGIPLVGEDVAGGVRGTFSAAGDPLIQFGIDLERLLITIAALIAGLLLAVVLVPWLNRYLPWRLGRLRRLGAAHRVIRRAHDLPDRAVNQILASRALHRLSYEELLDYSPDPFGDWSRGRYRRLARAELESVGLRG